MEENEPFLYSYLPFRICATDLGTEQPYVVYDTPSQLPSSCYSGCTPPIEPMYATFADMSRLQTTSDKRNLQPERKAPQVFCQRCCKPVVDSGNWCSSCGELLIGASLCPSESSGWNAGGASFRPLQMAHAEPVHFTTEIFPHSIGNSGGYMQSYSLDEKRGLFDDNQSFHHRATSTIATEPSVATASFASNSCLTTPHTRTQRAEENAATTGIAEQTCQAFHVAETSVPPAMHVESLKSVFDEMQLKNESPVSVGALQYMNSTQQEYASPCLETIPARSPRIASSQPESMDFLSAVYSAYRNPPNKFDCTPMACVVQQLSAGRQRCISGPVRNNPKPADSTMTTEFRRFEYPFVAPSVGHVPRSFASSFGSPSQESSVYLTDSWPTSSSLTCRPHVFPSSITSSSLRPDMFPATEFVPPNINTYSSVPALRRDRTRRTASRQRQKHGSECSKSRIIPSGQDKPVEITFRPRSSSSDFRSSGLNSLHLMPTKVNHAQCLWPSSRVAWSAHDPASLKKKPANYLRASFSHGSNTPSNHHRSFHSDNTGRCDASLSAGSLRPVSRSAQPKLRGEHVVHQEHGLGRFSYPDTRNNQVPESPFAQVEGRPRKGRSHRNSSRRATDTAVGRHRRKSRGSSANPNTSTRASSHSRITSSKISPRMNPSHSTISDPCEGHPDWMSLPDELWLSVIRLLPTVDRGRLAQACRRFANLVTDRSLWHVINLHRHQHLTDTALASIGRLRPRELRLTYCRGDTIGEEGLRCMFQACGTRLRKLSFIGCTKGPFDRDIPLLLAAEHCPNLSHVNASYTQAVRDQTVIALAKSAFHLVSVKLNGAQQISNTAIQQLVHYHKDTLQRLELFGCFRLNSDIFQLLGRCQELRALAFGHLHHLSSDGLLELVGKLPHLASLDLRGTQTLANDTNLTRLADKCPHLEEVVLANMHSLKGEAGIAQMLRRLPRLRVLDLCGLSAVGDLTMEALAQSCPQLEELDVSCTSVTQTGLLHLARVPARCLRCLRISHCRDITKDILEKLVKACSRLTLLYAYGFNSIKDWSFLQAIRPALLVETDT